MDKYVGLIETKSIKLLKAAHSAIDKLIDLLNTMDPNERDERGRPIYKATEVMVNLKGVGDVVEGLNKLENQVRKEASIESDIRGGGKKGRREDPK